MKRFLNIIYIALAAVLSCCSDEFDMPDQGTGVEEGLPATVTVRLSAEDHRVQSRAVVSNTIGAKINNVWVAMFDDNGKVTFKEFYDETELRRLAATGEYEITFRCRSGRQNLVAVANPDGNYGVRIHENDADEGVASFHTLLEQVETLDEYKNLATVLNDATQIDRITANFPMSGVYRTSHSHYDPSDAIFFDPDKNDEPTGWVDIPVGDVSLPGVIHLRRQAAYSRVNLIPADHIEMLPLSWRVVNLPALAFISQQSTNAADVSTALLKYPYYNYSNFNSSALQRIFDNGPATDSKGDPVFVGTITDSNGNPQLSTSPTASNRTQRRGSAFEFYTNENIKHGLDHVKTYHDREAEFKNADGTNSGAFRSLVSSADLKDSPANKATYVEVEVQLDYWALQQPDGSMVCVAPNTAGALHRTGVARFTVHMGYCKGSTDQEKARDFSIDRNTAYTYNVFINGIDNIRIEAQADGPENQPGLEGDLSDAKMQAIALDSHYAQFNVKLSNLQREKFSYQVSSPFHNTEWVYNSEDPRPDSQRGPFYDQFIHWVRIRPTIEEGYMALYKSDEYPADQAEPMTLEEFADCSRFPALNANGTTDPKPERSSYASQAAYETALKNWQNKEHWYTVFVDEYVYEYDEDGSKLSPKQWYYYANKGSRVVWLMSEGARQVSSDKESTYIRAEYIITQRSIQTFYNADPSLNANLAPTAIGLEHRNESLGFNLTYPSGFSIAGLDYNSGRINMSKYLKNNRRTWKSVTDGKQKTVARRTYNKVGVNPGVSNSWWKPYADTEPETFSFQLADASSTFGTRNKNQYSVNSSAEARNVMEVCLSRNRDTNGNGQIDDDELRWVLPTYATYARIVAGSTALQSPLLDFSSTPTDLQYKGWSSGNYYNGLYHFACSDGRMLWAEEGLSFTADATTNHERNWFWNLRCVRNLGQDTEDLDDIVTQAYEVSGNVFTMTYYDKGTLRAPITAMMPLHSVDEIANTFCYQWEVYPQEEIVTGFGNIDGIKEYFFNNTDRVKDYNPCEKRGGGWRIPNQKELTLMQANGFIAQGHLHLSSTLDVFQDEKNEYRILGHTDGLVQALSSANLSSNTRNTYVRCVRDKMSSASTLSNVSLK